MDFTPATAALLVKRNGGTDEESIFLASMLPGENRGGDPAIVNERYSCGEEDGRQLHAVGVFQICEYSDRGTRQELQDPDHNAREALKILRSQGREAWTATPDPDAADEARRALTEGAPMETWHPRAIHAGANRAGSSMIGVPWKLVLHTIEGPATSRYSYDAGSYYGNPYWPHATIDSAGIHQHLGIDQSAFALANAAGGAETNRANAIQCEIMGQAAKIGELPEATWLHLADWLTWCAAQTGTPLVFADFRGDGSYGENAPQRFGAQEWLDFAGICGHQHVPENDHWDPGALPVSRLTALMGADQEDDFMATFTDDEKADLLGTLRAIRDTGNRIERALLTDADAAGGTPAGIPGTVEAIQSTFDRDLIPLLRELVDALKAK